MTDISTKLEPHYATKSNPFSCTNPYDNQLQPIKMVWDHEEEADNYVNGVEAVDPGNAFDLSSLKNARKIKPKVVEKDLGERLRDYFRPSQDEPPYLAEVKLDVSRDPKPPAKTDYATTLLVATAVLGVLAYKAIKHYKK